MGDILGGVVSGIGSYLGAQAEASASKAATQAALTGYNYLINDPNNQQYANNGAAANQQMSQLLGLAPATDATKAAYDNYLNSTGYQFQLQQGGNAISSQGAASGLLNSGGTAKGLEAYGQNLGGQYFNNYLSQLGGVAQSGQQSILAPATAASYAAGPASAATQNVGNAQAQGYNALFGTVGSVLSDPSVSGSWT